MILRNTLDGFPRARRIDILDNLRQTRLLDSKIKCKKSGDNDVGDLKLATICECW